MSNGRDGRIYIAKGKQHDSGNNPKDKKNHQIQK